MTKNSKHVQHSYVTYNGIAYFICDRRSENNSSYNDHHGTFKICSLLTIRKFVIILNFEDKYLDMITVRFNRECLISELVYKHDLL